MKEKDGRQEVPGCAQCGDPFMRMNVEGLEIELCPRCDGVPLCPDDARIIVERRARERAESRDR